MVSLFQLFWATPPSSLSPFPSVGLSLGCSAPGRTCSSWDQLCPAFGTGWILLQWWRTVVSSWSCKRHFGGLVCFFYPGLNFYDWDWISSNLPWGFCSGCFVFFLIKTVKDKKWRSGSTESFCKLSHCLGHQNYRFERKFWEGEQFWMSQRYWKRYQLLQKGVDPCILTNYVSWNLFSSTCVKFHGLF